jgi:hypothetical protein
MSSVPRSLFTYSDRLQKPALYRRSPFANLSTTLSRKCTILSRNEGKGIRVFEILNLQPIGHTAKAYQVKQVRKVILQYKLGDDI